MTAELNNLTLGQRLLWRWRRGLGVILHWWVKSRALPDDFASLGIDPGRPSCYVLDSYALSSLLVLDRCCEVLELPSPILPLSSPQHEEQRSFAALRRQRGVLIRRPQVRSTSELLTRLVHKAYKDPGFDLQLIPVSVMVGRAPDKEQSLAKILFAEDWKLAGRLRRLLSTWINGRNTFVQFSRPISLRQLADEDIGASRSVRKVSRILRTHFHRSKEAAIGPDLSHRRTLISNLVNQPRVREAMAAKMRREKITEAKARRIAEKHAREIAANYSYPFIRIMALLLGWFWNRIYDGIILHHFKGFREAAHGKEIVYVPCHRSHIDYALLSYFLYQNGFVPPHIAAGVNLNLPIVGALIRKGGGFFLRRSFRSNLLYAAIFDEYVSMILAKGVAMEYFIEGTRSRTGRLLQPKAGMIAMTVRGFLRSPQRPVLFQPIYIGYERLAEGNVYTDELSGKPKKSESTWDLINIFRLLRRKYGKVHVSFGQAIHLEELLDQHNPQWRTENHAATERPDWLPPVVDQLAAGIMTGINCAAIVNPINLLALVILATPKHAIGAADLIRQIDLYKDLLGKAPMSERVEVTDMVAGEILRYGLELGVIQRTEHALGDIISAEPKQAVLLTYFRNNSAHLFLLPAYIACCFLNQQKFGRQRMQRLFRVVYPFLKAELFLPWEVDQAQQVLADNIQALVDLNLIDTERNGAMLVRATGGSDRAIALKLLGHSLLQTFERYYITIAVLVKNGPGALSGARLERLSMLTAQRISQLSEFDAPDFYDKNLFKQFIGKLREMGILRRDSDGNLEYDEVLVQVVDDAKLLLSKEIRHGIIQLAPSMLEPVGKEAT